MEWVSHLAGEPHSDEPTCVSVVVRAFCTTFNDSLQDTPRQRLRPYLGRTIGTAGDGLDVARSWMAMDWLVRDYTPTWLRLAGLEASARASAEAPAVVEGRDLKLVLELMNTARREARAAWSAALGAPRATLWAVPWAAGRAAARAAAWSSAGAAAWAAARVEVGDITGDRVRAAAREIAGDAAAIAVRDARTATSRSAAREAARSALAPTLEQLRESAFALLDRMLPTVSLDAPTAVDADLVRAG
jgi:hypothetical protein